MSTEAQLNLQEAYLVSQLEPWIKEQVEIASIPPDITDRHKCRDHIHELVYAAAAPIESSINTTQTELNSAIAYSQSMRKIAKNVTLAVIILALIVAGARESIPSFYAAGWVLVASLIPLILWLYYLAIDSKRRATNISVSTTIDEKELLKWKLNQVSFFLAQYDRGVQARIDNHPSNRLGVVEAPEAIDHSISPNEAERLAARWMRYLGAWDAKVTQYSGDGGIDVVSDIAIAQVKHYAASPVPVSAIRDLAGVAAYEEKTALFFTSSNYTKEGIRFASKVKMALFVYQTSTGGLVAVNQPAKQIIEYGLGFAD